LGLDYRVWSSAEIDWILQRNIQFLEDYLRCDPASAAGFVDPAIKAVIEAKPGILLGDLLDGPGLVPKPDEIYLLIATGGVYVDLGAAAIVERSRFASSPMRKLLAHTNARIARWRTA
jgi:putative transposase